MSTENLECDMHVSQIQIHVVSIFASLYKTLGLG